LAAVFVGLRVGVFLFFLKPWKLFKNNFSLRWQSKLFCNFWSVRWLVRIANVLALALAVN